MSALDRHCNVCRTNERYGSGACAECSRRKQRERRAANKSVAERERLWRLNNQHRVKATFDRWKSENAEHLKNYRLTKLYGITTEDRNALILAQGDRCAVPGCEEILSQLKSKNVHVEHDHVTGCVRGIVCHSCNIAIGHYERSKERGADILGYLNRGGN